MPRINERVVGVKMMQSITNPWFVYSYGVKVLTLGFGQVYVLKKRSWPFDVVVGSLLLFCCCVSQKKDYADSSSTSVLNAAI